MKKDPDAGRDWGQEEKGTTEDEIIKGSFLNKKAGIKKNKYH